jgi:hypothetical protein
MFFTVLLLLATMALPLSSQGGTVRETEDLRDRIVVESGLQIFSPNAVRGAWELYLLGKQVWWSGKILGIAALEPDPRAPIVLASRDVPKFTVQDVSQAFGNREIVASERTVALFNELAAIEEPLTANIIAFTRAMQSYKQAAAAQDEASKQARLEEARRFGEAIKDLSQKSLGVMQAIVEQHRADGLGNPVLTPEEAAAFIKEVQVNGLPADEQKGLLALGLPEETLRKLEAYIAEADPAGAAGIDLMNVFLFGMEVNAQTPAEVDKDLADLLAEAIIAFDLPHRPLGLAKLEFVDNVLTVSNLESGEDGVAIDLPQTDNLSVEVDGLKDGAILRTTAFGEIDGTPGQLIGAAQVAVVGNMTEISGDFDGVKAELNTVEVYNGDRLVANITDLLGVDAIRIPIFPPIVIDPWLCWPRPPCIPWWIFRWREPAPIDLGRFGLGVVEGTEIRLGAVAGDPSPQPSLLLSEVRLQAINAASFAIIGETFMEPPGGPMIPFEYTHTVDINGEQGVAKATGRIDLARGRLIYEGVIDRYIPGYRWWPVSWLTLIIISGGPIFALEEGGAVNLHTLTKGELGYKVEVTTQDDFADILTEIAVERRGETIVATLNSTGTARYPEVVAMAQPVVRLVQTPTSGGFVEEGVKQLIAEDGAVIKSFVKAVYSGVELPSSQLREVSLSALEESKDGLSVRLQIDNIVKLRDEKTLPFEYVHAVDINGERGAATATGLIDLARGRLIYDGFVDRYIIGYRWWPVSWLTLIIISGGPVFALEEAGAQNLLSLTKGALGHKVEVHTTDEFADITTNIGVEFRAGTVSATLNSVGKAAYPDIVGMSRAPVVFSQTPNPDGGFIERGAKELTAADGRIIKTSVTATYSGVELPSPQQRVVNLSILEESADRQYVKLQVDNVVKPLVEEKLVYNVELWAGVNLLAVPLDPSPPEWRLSDLARHIGEAVSFIVWYDHAAQRFISYFTDFPETSSANKMVSGGEGYIVVMKEPTTVRFEGRGWSNTPAAPPLHAGAISTLAVDGQVFDDRTGGHLNSAKVVVRNLRTGAVAENVIGAFGASGRFVVTFASLDGQAVVEAGDMLEIRVVNAKGERATEPMVYPLTADALQSHRMTLETLWVAPIPEKFALFNNYPNPFNPETWIPYQLPERATVSIEIYDASGRIVRALYLGEQPAGTYLSRARAAYWDGRNTLGESAVSGVYFYALKAVPLAKGDDRGLADAFSDVKKMVILK